MPTLPVTPVMIHIILAFTLLSRESAATDEQEIRVQQVTGPVQHAEGPHWLESDQALYFVDIAGYGVHRYEPYTNRHTFITLKNTVGVLIPVKDEIGKFVIGYGKNISVLSWDGQSKSYSIEHKFKVDDKKVGNRFNDGKADIHGRLWIGTMGEEKPIGVVKLNQGSLFKVSHHCELTSQVTPVSISNGIAWNADNTQMYYIDSPTRRVDVFDYNTCSGKISNRRTFFDFELNNVTGVPDGMTIDSDDNLWVAVWGGGKVIQVSSEGELVGAVDMPVERVTSAAWGGRDYEILFVTTMRLGLSKAQLRSQPQAGAVFKVTGLSARGRPANPVSACILSTPGLE